MAHLLLTHLVAAPLEIFYIDVHLCALTFSSVSLSNVAKHNKRNKNFKEIQVNHGKGTIIAISVCFPFNCSKIMGGGNMALQMLLDGNSHNPSQLDVQVRAKRSCSATAVGDPHLPISTIKWELIIVF